MPLLDGARTKVKSGLANLSFFLGLGGGALAAVSMIGGALAAIVNIGPWWSPPIAFAVAFIICLGDWAEGDAIPNRRAVYTAMVFPSFFVASVTGDCGSKLFAAFGDVPFIGEKTAQGWEKSVNDWLTLSKDLENACTVFSLILIGAAITYAQMFARKNKAAVAAGGVAARRVGR